MVDISHLPLPIGHNILSQQPSRNFNVLVPDIYDKYLKGIYRIFNLYPCKRSVRYIEIQFTMSGWQGGLSPTTNPLQVKKFDEQAAEVV